MTTFIQMHLLTAYPPANLNRDDMGRPKTCAVGGVERLRVSSQSLKRAWRTSELWERALAGNLGVRTKEMGIFVYKALTEGIALEDLVYARAGGKALPPLKDKPAREAAKAIAEVFGKLDAAKPDKDADKEAAPDPSAGAQAEAQPLRELKLKQLAHFAPEEVAAIAALAEAVRADGKAPGKDALQLLRKNLHAADIALFGRMLADEPAFNVEAACQVGHAFSVERVAVEDDFFTAVDDLNREDMGAGHMGVTEFGSGVFYLYACIDKDLLAANLGGDADLAARALRALVQAMATVAPTGKQNSFASRAYASFILAEKGPDQPRSLTAAFVKPVEGRNVLEDAVQTLLATRDRMNTVYGLDALDSRTLNALTGEGSLQDILDFAAGD
ncbi:type I-E CRISPR-associated protein Cas7/Cse4/CasC [Fundidesulfovibrio butyratiphilus]